MVLDNGVTGLTLLHQDEEEVLLVGKKMKITVVGPTPLAMKVLLLLLQIGTEMETMRLEKNRAMKQRIDVVVEEQFQGRHQDPGPGLWRYLQDETYVKKWPTKTLCNALWVLHFSSSASLCL
jgi:ferredoxin-NADP reductase